MNIFKIFRGDRGENSIMQTVTIAVSAILLVAGTVGAPSAINSARISAAHTNIGIINTAQNSYIAKKGLYADELSDLKTGFAGKYIDLSQCQGGALDDCKAIKLFRGGNLLDGSCYMVFNNVKNDTVLFSQGKNMKDAKSNVVRIPVPWPSTPRAFNMDGTPVADFAANYDSACKAWPTYAEVSG